MPRCQAAGKAAGAGARSQETIMHRFVILSAMLAVMLLGGCVAGNGNRADDLYRAQMSQRHNPPPDGVW
jgi:hypothetical protein